MDTSILEDLGLSNGEIKVYLSLLELGSTKIGSIIEKSQMASSAVHNDINTLVEKGLVSYIKKGKIKYYQAVSPRNLVNFIEDKKKALMEMLPELEGKQKRGIEKQEAEVFEGIKGVTTLLNILIENTKKGEDYMFFSSFKIDKNKEIQEFFEKYDIKRQEKGLYIRGLTLKELKPLFVKRKMIHMKYPDFPIPFDVSLCNGKVVLISWGEKPIGYLIKSKEIFEMYKDYFERVWKMS
jgi:sugar-specific transcriptional regulator TrmB